MTVAVSCTIGEVPLKVVVNACRPVRRASRPERAGQHLSAGLLPSGGEASGPDREPGEIAEVTPFGYEVGWPGCAGPIRYGRIISLSSCSTMWQCHTNWPGESNLIFTRVT